LNNYLLYITKFYLTAFPDRNILCQNSLSVDPVSLLFQNFSIFFNSTSTLIVYIFYSTILTFIKKIIIYFEKL